MTNNFEKPIVPYGSPENQSMSGEPMHEEHLNVGDQVSNQEKPKQQIGFVISPQNNEVPKPSAESTENKVEVSKTVEVDAPTKVNIEATAKVKVEITGDGKKKRGEGDELGKRKTKKTETAERQEMSEAERRQKEVKAAEILCLVDHNTKPEEYPAALDRLHNEFSKKAIEQAIKVADLRAEAERVYSEAVRSQQSAKNKDKTLPQIGKEYQRESRRKYDLLHRDNLYYPELKKLKTILLEDKNKSLEKDFGKGDARVLEKMMSYEQYLARTLVTEMLRDNDVKKRILDAESVKHEGVFKKAVRAFSKLPRPIRTAIGAGIFGTGVAVIAPSMIIGAVPGYLLYRTLRGLSGGAIAAGLQKLFGDRIVSAAYEKDIRKEYQSLENTLGGEQSLQKRQIEHLIETKQWERLADINYDIAGKHVQALEKHEKTRRWTTAGMMITTGLVGGVAGANLFDYLFGPKGTLAGVIQEDSRSKGGGALEQEPGKTGGAASAGTGAAGAVEGTPPGSGGGGGATEAIPTKPSVNAWEFETAKSGDSVWRVIEHDLHKNVPDFNNLPKAQQIYIIDHYKDAVAANPAKFGLTNPDQIKPGWGKEIEHLFDDKNEMTKIMGKAKGLSPREMQNILDQSELNRIKYQYGDRLEKIQLKPNELIPLKQPDILLKPTTTIPPGVEVAPIGGGVGAGASPDELCNFYEARAHGIAGTDTFSKGSLADQETMLKQYQWNIDDLERLHDQAKGNSLLQGRIEQDLTALKQQADWLEDAPAYTEAQERLQEFTESTKIDGEVWDGLKEIKTADVLRLADADGTTKVAYEITKEAGLNTNDAANIVNNLKFEKTHLADLAQRIKGVQPTNYDLQKPLGDFVKTFISKDKIGL
ncbi:hypothetical protein HY967_01140 [Candidatus Jorgensenbacteria bacterium]|nr:hypothetical protein [Candidatus Jorgensenbacteria bacterium]